MRFAFTEDQRLYRGAVQEYLGAECTPARVREAAASGTGLDASLWRGLAGLGMLGTLMPEDTGGLGLDEVSAMVLCEEAGRVAFPGPLIETALVAPAVLAGSPLGTEWLPRIAMGDAVVAIALSSDRFVAHAGGADLIVQVGLDATHAQLGGSAEVVAVESVDPGRPLYEVRSGYDLEVQGQSAGQRPLHAAALRGALGAAATLVGLGERVIELAAEHARTREQFGVPIGSFQGVKHLLADALVAVSFARPVVERAAWSVASDEPVVHTHVAMAKARAGRAAEQAARAALQVHGAIGYTWESDLHLWMKRIWALTAAWGTTDQHRDVVADTLGL
ncbi:MAG: acyl-CoA/acyl-ACP dehydrogenase [Actinobacteria bacterium]|nr:acyl-CoA/acyl-ACP dehydrogenase [Actinomycetota bacterium]